MVLWVDTYGRRAPGADHHLRVIGSLELTEHLCIKLD